MKQRQQQTNQPNKNPTCQTMFRHNEPSLTYLVHQVRVTQDLIGHSDLTTVCIDEEGWKSSVTDQSVLWCVVPGLWNKSMYLIQFVSQCQTLWKDLHEIGWSNLGDFCSPNSHLTLNRKLNFAWSQYTSEVVMAPTENGNLWAKLLHHIC